MKPIHAMRLTREASIRSSATIIAHHTGVPASDAWDEIALLGRNGCVPSLNPRQHTANVKDAWRSAEPSADRELAARRMQVTENASRFAELARTNRFAPALKVLRSIMKGDYR